jgi:4-hydroxy-3-polyprenylbenzoate decarboxylase
VIGVSGASGSLLAMDLLQQIHRLKNWETNVVIIACARHTLTHEMRDMPDCLDRFADYLYSPEATGAKTASGTFRIDGMVVVHCSMKTAAGIYSGYSENLLLRAADVTIKECRTLVLCIRESPLSPIHLQDIQQLSEIGVHILPPMMTFYNRPDTIQDMVRHHTGKILHIFHEEAEGYERWSGLSRNPPC